MKSLIILTLLISSAVQAETDYSCVSNCTSQDMSFSFCQDRCSFDRDKNEQEDRHDTDNRTDFTCVRRLTEDRDYSYGYAANACSY